MANLEAAKKLVMNMTKSLPHDAIEKAASGLAPSIITDSGEINLSGIQIPFVTTDEDVLKIIDEFQLKKPENMIRFMVEGHFAQFESIHDSINQLKRLDLINIVGKVRGPIDTYIQAMENPDSREYILSGETGKLNEAFRDLESKIEDYIDTIRKIDNRSALSFFLRSKLDLNSIDTNNHLAKSAVEAAVQAINLQILIASDFGWKTDSLMNKFKSFKDKVISDDNCTLMHAYDDKKDEEFWLKLPQRLENAINTEGLLREFNESTEEEDFDLNNIEFE